MAAAASLHYSFAGRRVLVTGGTSGIGRGIVDAFYADGASVFVLDRNAEALMKLPKVTTVCVDLLNWAETRTAVEALGPLDHLVNNAGIAEICPAGELSEESFDRTIGVNLKAVLNVSQAFVKGVMARPGGAGGATIVNISSVMDSRAFAGISAYCTSKAGLTMLTKSMALEFGAAGGFG